MGPSVFSSDQLLIASCFSLTHQQLRQLGYAGCDLARFVLGHEMRRGAPAWLAFEIHVGHGEIVGVADAKG